MTLPTSEPIPDENQSLPPARRRRGRRQLVPPDAEGRASVLNEIARRMSPSFDFFLFSLLAGAVIGGGILLNSPAILVLAALIAPFMAPIIGLSLAIIVGSARYFFQNLGAAFIGAVLVFVVGALTGFGAQIWPGLSPQQISLHSHFTWPDLFVLVVGTILTTLSLIRSEEKPLIPSVAIAYELYLPLGAAGFGLVSGGAGLWPDGLVVFLVYLTTSILIGTLVMAFMGFRPMTSFGYTLGTTIVLIGILLAIGLSGIGTAFRAQIALPSATPSLSPTVTVTQTLTPAPPTATITLTPTNTLIPTRTLTQTPTPAPTPVWAAVNAPVEQKGAVIRDNPDGKVLTTVSNGELVQILGETLRQNNILWVKIRTTKGVEGWMVMALLVTATPIP